MSKDTEPTSLLESEPFYQTDYGAAYQGNSKDLLEELPNESLDLVVTSPPFALQHQKEYGNKSLKEYNDWFMEFADRVYPKLKPHGSFVIEIGGAFEKGKPKRSTYQFKLLDRLTSSSEDSYYLSQDFYWHNPAKLPNPIEWVNVRRIRVTDAVTHIWWLSKEITGDSAKVDGESPHPEADNRRVLRDYSNSQKQLLETGEYNDGERPSGWDIDSEAFATDNEGSIPDTLLEGHSNRSTEEALENISAQKLLDEVVGGTDLEDISAADLLELFDAEELVESGSVDNLIKASNTASNTHYLSMCREFGYDTHPARFPRQIPEFFIKFLTPEPPYDDSEPPLVLDIFGGSNLTGKIAEDLGRNWLTFELDEDYLFTSQFRFLAEEEIRTLLDDDQLNLGDF